MFYFLWVLLYNIYNKSNGRKYLMKEKYYITTAIAYTSSKPHIGNTYEAILADSMARFKRRQGYDVFFQTGTDEHGQKIEEKASACGKTPKEYVDEVSNVIKSIWKTMNVSYDKFIRTTDEEHEKQVQKIFKKFYEQGDIYKGSYEGWYCTPCESFWTESQLVDGKCPDCGREVKKAHEEAYFFKMSKYAQRLIDHINANPDFIVPVSRKNEMMNNFLLPGLQDLCVSRTSFKWGIPVDFDSRHVVYVWLDALTNYITGIGFDVDGNHGDLYKKYWPADVHVIGKDIIRFHTIYWPIFLMAMGEPLPKQVFGHPWLLQEGGKMSKSKGNVLYADDLVSVYGVDAVRYYVLNGMPFDNDGLVSWNLMTDKINGELANVYGNLVKRTISMSNKYFDGKVERSGVTDSIDDDLKNLAKSTYSKVSALMDECKIADAIDCVFTLLRRANKYIDETAPWVLAKDESNQARLKEVMYNLTETIVIASSILEPFMPETSAEVLLELNTEIRDYGKLSEFGLYPDGNVVTKEPKVIFARLDNAEVLKKAEEIANKYIVKEEKEEEKLPEITIDDFAKIQLKTALVTACEKVAKSKKLLKLSLKVGNEMRTVASGIAEYYTPEEMVGKKVVLVYNLKPAKLCGVESQGMILCAEADGKVKLVTPEDANLPDGATVR
ncbi:MAG: methionine--tRNA ligase [Clostridiales bacterium]|nr:methionine--tRNA ligase [Clostridiales bacterium]